MKRPGMSPTQEVGQRCEGAVMAALLRAGKLVLVPHSDCRYDLLVDEDGKFIRIQCKNGRFDHHGWVEFNADSLNLVQGKYVRNNYVGQADMFGVYCHAINRVYLIPVTSANNSRTKIYLRPPRIKVSRVGRPTLMAQDYEILPERRYRFETLGSLVIPRLESE